MMRLLLISLTGLLFMAAIMPRTIVSITFDDGLASQYNASLILDEYGFKGTFYVCPGLNEFEGNELMSWEQIINVQSRGHEIGCHTMTHVNASAISREEFEQELIACKQATNATSFAYPYGQGLDKSDLVYKYFNSARLVQQGINEKGSSEVKSLIFVHDRFDQRMDWLKEWLESGDWVAITIHGVTDEPRGLIDITPGEFRQILDVVRSSGAQVVRVSEG
jgi:peptidoglycan/xylan/chitin deacetylase (PgdA/CDA1 family)